MKIQVNNVELFYEKMGKGAPLILLHGNGEGHQTFKTLMEALKDSFTIYAIDSRNHGQSEVTDNYSYQTMADDVTAFIETLNLKEVRILGFSDGGIIALLMAMNPQVPLHSIAVLGANMSSADFKPEILESIQKGYQENPNPLLKLMLEEPNMTNEDLAKITIPVFVFQGEDDIYKAEAAENIAKGIMNTQSKVMLGHNHSSYIEQNDIIAEDVRKFFLK